MCYILGCGFKLDHWIGRVALVTGSSAGIGEAIAKSLTKSGMIVIGVARNTAKIEVDYNS